MTTVRKTITVTTEQDQWIQAQIAAGAFTNDVDHVMRLDKCEAWLHSVKVIHRFVHRGLQRLFEQGDERRLPPAQIRKLKRMLHQLDLAKTSKDMDIPGWQLHKLKGELKEYWAVWVTGNDRLWFRFEDGHVWDVNYGDYH